LDESESLVSQGIPSFLPRPAPVRRVNAAEPLGPHIPNLDRVSAIEAAKKVGRNNPVVIVTDVSGA
jgi:hypothetical protein